MSIPEADSDYIDQWKYGGPNAEDDHDCRYREALERIAAGPWSHTKHSSRAMVAIARAALDGDDR